LRIASQTVTLPTVTSDENGPGTADTSTTYFDIFGRPIWTKDGDGFLNYTAYDPATGAVTKFIQDVDTTQTSNFSNLPSGWSTPSGGGANLITTYTVDGLGRTTKVTNPAGNSTYTVYNDPNHEYRVYPGWDSTAHTTTGPTRVYREDRSSSTGYTEVLTMSATPAFSSNVPTGTESISSVQSLSRNYISAGGQITRTDVYFNLSGVTYSTSLYIGTANTNYYSTLFYYNHRGLLEKTVAPTGTITRTVYDGLGRVVSKWIGTNDTPASGYWSPTNNTSPSNMVEVSSDVYDGGGVGDSNLTQVTNYPGGSAANQVTQFSYDWRDRLVATKQGVEGSESTSVNRPILYYEYDNLSEVTALSQFDGDAVTITSTGGVPNKPSSSLLRAYVTNAYDEQGRVYETKTFSVDPSSGTVSTYALTTDRWFDHRGNAIKTSQPGGQVMKYTFDGADRVVATYTTDGGGDSSWTDASNVTGDKVLTQTTNAYDGDGNPILVITRDRFDDETATGALNSATSSPKARVSYVAYYYDAADRLGATVNVGTNAGSSYTRPGTAPSGSDTVLVKSYTYNAAGWQDNVTDASGLANVTLYDARGRVTKTIQDYTSGTPTSASDATTEYTYDGDNHVLSLKVDLPSSAIQETQFVYGVTTGSGSTLNSNDILSATKYPDPSTGAASSSNKETYTADALGERLTYNDRNGNTHTYSYDVVGRQTTDTVTTLGSGVDGAVRRLETAYNTQGLPYLYTSYDSSAGGSVVNQVQDVFNGLGQLITEYQAHSGAVNTSTSPKVQYAYVEMASGANNSRMTSMTYPNGRVLRYNYASGLDASISRLSSISDTSGTLESYKYLGLSTIVEMDHPETNVNLTYISQTGGTGDAGDKYVGLDRFGRVVDQNWFNTGTSSSTDDFQYGYDRDSNVLWMNNALSSANSELYGYNGLNELTSFERGTLNSGKTGITGTPSVNESWGFDAVGNWTSVVDNSSTQTRTANADNQIASISGLTTPGYDANGNTTTDQSGKTLVYDAWNRLVKYKSGSTVLTAYGYDAIGRKITENPGSARDIYFSRFWQNIEEDVSGTPQDQYVWGAAFIDQMIERDRDADANTGNGMEERLFVQQAANRDVTGLVNTSGALVERYQYDPYGTTAVLTGSWAGRGSTSYAWNYFHQAGRLDAITGLYDFRNRQYSPQLGRWMNEDPLRLRAGDPNLYRYVNNEPSASDPLGLQPDAMPGGAQFPYYPPNGNQFAPLGSKDNPIVVTRPPQGCPWPWFPPGTVIWVPGEGPFTVPTPTPSRPPIQPPPTWRPGRPSPSPDPTNGDWRPARPQPQTPPVCPPPVLGPGHFPPRPGEPGSPWGQPLPALPSAPGVTLGPPILLPGTGEQLPPKIFPLQPYVPPLLPGQGLLGPGTPIPLPFMPGTGGPYQNRPGPGYPRGQ
jgi:RHS repeat-associated protein